MSFKTPHKGKKTENTFINNGLTEFKIELEYLKNDAELFSEDKISVEKLRETIKKTRNSFKEIEFFVAYHYPEFTKTHLNAAPLFHIEVAGTSAYTLPPEGLQVLDELIYSDEAKEEKEEIKTITNFLYNSYANFYLSALKNGLSKGTNKTLPLRIELIRIYSLGVTGFDTPGSLNISEETSHALTGMKNYISDDEYFRNFKTEKALHLLEKSVQYLEKNTDFETFDRIEFYKNYIQPLYEELGSWDGNSDDLKNFSGWNVSNKDFFKADFFDPYFYTLLKKSEDSDELKKLGEKIFYDTNFSANGEMSCASCHLPENAYTDLQPKSVSNAEGKTVLRNSPSLYNAVFAKRFFYDMRAFYLEQQAEHVIYNKEEFNTDYEKIVQKLNNDKDYKAAFSKLFKDKKITKQNFSKALSSFVASLYSFESDFDRFMRNEKEISEDAKKGFNLFMGKAQCAICHFVPLFNGTVPPNYKKTEQEVLGVAENALNRKLDSDPGRGKFHETVAFLQNSFKTPTLRNISKTAPYMHNGGYKTLQEVMEFYNKGGGKGFGMKVDNQTLSDTKLNLSQTEIDDIIEFLNSLNDK